MVAIRFFRNNQVIGAKEFLDEDKAVRVGEAWYKMAMRKYPAHTYHFELIKTVFIMEGRKNLDGSSNNKRFTSFTEMICFKEQIPNVELISLQFKFDEKHFNQGRDWKKVVL